LRSCNPEILQSLQHDQAPACRREIGLVRSHPFPSPAATLSGVGSRDAREGDRTIQRVADS
jgi:hypothetical protein